jgi:DNA-binding LacI/PurR family transcriptional regulator
MFRPARFGSDVNFIDIENAAGGRMVAELLISLGHRRIAFINDPNTHVDAMERERGFLEALAGAVISDVTKRYGDFLIQSGFSAMSYERDTGKERPEAVFCANDYMAAGAIKRLSESGIRVPGDVSVIGYDNNDICQGIVPSLTTVDHRLEELGQCLGRGLLDLIDGTETEVRKTIMPVLVERQSHSLRRTNSQHFNRTTIGRRHHGIVLPEITLSAPPAVITSALRTTALGRKFFLICFPYLPRSS